MNKKEKVVILEDSSELKQLNEMFVKVEESLPTSVENSIFYPKLKQLLFGEIVNFCKEQLELKADLQLLRMNIGEQLPESEIREYLDTLKKKYNSIDNNCGLDYHIEATRIDYGVAVFVVIKRTIILMKKFVFRFKKINISDSVSGLSSSNIPIKESLMEQAKEMWGEE